MDKNIGTPALLSDNAPLLPVNCCNDKCFGIHMFISFVCIGTTPKTLRKKCQIWLDFTQNSKNGLDKIIDTLICGSTPFGKKLLESIASCDHEWVSYNSLLEFWTTLLLPTAPGLSHLKGAFSQLLIWDCATGVQWDLDLDSSRPLQNSPVLCLNHF